MTALQDALSAHLLRRDKASVEHSLPPRQEVFVPVKLTRVQRQWYARCSRLPRPEDPEDGYVLAVETPDPYATHFISRYRALIEKNVGFLHRAGGGGGGGGGPRINLTNLAMELRKVRAAVGSNGRPAAARSRARVSPPRHRRSRHRPASSRWRARVSSRRSDAASSDSPLLKSMGSWGCDEAA